MILLESCKSTQDEALENLRKNPNTKSLWVRSLKQTEGRGRQGKEWLSPQGNIYLSGAFRIEPQTSKHWPLVSLIAGLALGRSLKKLNLWDETRFFIKWPNDLYSKPRHKIAGLLSELKNNTLIVGFGINTQEAPQITSPDNSQNIYSSRSLKEIFTKDVDNDVFCKILISEFEEIFYKWLEDKTKNTQSQIHEELRNVWMKNYWGLKIQDLSSKDIYRTVDLSPNASLILSHLETNDIKEIHSGEWQLL